MQNETNRKIWIGVMALSGAVLFLVSIFLIGRKQSMFGHTFRLYCIFSNVNGLEAGNYVRFSGVRTGIVDNISFLNDSMIVVTLKLDRKLQHLIKKDDIVYISTEGLVGDKLVEIKPMWKSTVAVNDNDTLASAPPIDTHDVIDKLLATNSNVKIITTNLARLSQDLNRRNSILRTITSDSNASNNLRDILSGLKSSSGQFTLLANRLNEITEKINLDKGVAGILFHDTVIANRLRTTISSLQQAGNNAADITKRLDESISQTHNPNTVGMLMTDSVMASQLKQSIINLEESARKLDENMDALQHSFLLRRYFKKQNKNR